MKQPPRFELINIANELLVGSHDNVQLAFIADALAQKGIALASNYVIRDHNEAIADTFQQSWDRADVVIITGGMGALKRCDVRPIVANALGLELQKDESIAQLIESAKLTLGEENAPRYMRQAYKPAGSKFLHNPHTFTHGIHLEASGKHLFLLPSKPSELKAIFNLEVLPRLEATQLTAEKPAYIQLRSIGMDTAATERTLQPILDPHDGLAVEFSRYEGILDIHIEAAQSTMSWDELEAVAQECRKAIGDSFICFGRDSMEEVLFYQLLAMEKRFSIAEACTNGHVTQGFAALANSQAVFSGGTVANDKDSLVELGVPETLIEQHGLCSGEIAVAMAIAGSEKYTTDYALSVSAFEPASPDNPVGTVYIGYASPRGAWAHKVMYPNQKEAVLVRIKNAALNWIRLKLDQEKIEDYMATLDLDAE